MVDRALAFDRDQRYPDAASMLEDVRAVRASQRPARALQLLEIEGIDPEASTQPNSLAEALTEDPLPSAAIPVVWADASLLRSSAPLIDLEVSSLLKLPILDGASAPDLPPPAGPPPAPPVAPPRSPEITLRSQGAEADSAPPASDEEGEGS